MAAAKKGTKRQALEARRKEEDHRSHRQVRRSRGNKSVEEFRDALEKSVTLSRDRIQEVMDDAVKRGRMTRADAEKTVSRLVTKGRQQTDELLAELEKLLDQARKGSSRALRPPASAPRRPRAAPSSACARPPSPALVEADKLRRRAGVASSSPITGYDEPQRHARSSRA